MSIGVSTPAPLVACPFCGKQVAANMLQQHIAFSHPKAYQPADEPADTSPISGPSLPEMVPCPYCGIRFSKDTLDSHIATHHTYYCSVCGALYHSVEDLNAHFASVHGSGKGGAGGGGGGDGGGGGGPVGEKCSWMKTSQGVWMWFNGKNSRWYAEYDNCVADAVGGEDVTDGNGKDKEWKGYCFIATAAFGSDLAPELYRLRHIRDQHLPRWFVRLYYKSSPRIAQYISKREWMKAYVRAWIRLILRVL